MSRLGIRSLRVHGHPGAACAVGRTLLYAGVVAGVTTLLGCASSRASTEYIYKLYGGPARPEHEVATINLNDAARATIGERSVARTDYSRAQILPGAYPINWVCVHGASVLVEPSGFISASASADVELQAGHVYSLHCARTYGRGYRTYQWLVDDTADVIVAGEKKP